MTSKGLHVQDNSVVERRLRPIYEWLDAGNNKKALQECDKVLKKTPNLQCAKALKALAYLRMNKEYDCCSMLDGLTSEKPSDDATLQAMTICYRELQLLEKICKLYETAVKIDPSNEELHTHLFMSYVRVSDFKSQQQSAMALYKLKQRNPYYCWAVMSIILQATRGSDAGDKQKRSLLLSLAERMINKLITDNKLEAEQEAQLYVMVLELQDKREEILKVMDGPLGVKLITGSYSYSRLPYLIKLKKWTDVNLHCKIILADSVDHWNIWKEYINSVFALGTPENAVVNNINLDNGDDDLVHVDDTPEKAHEFICRLVENSSENGYLLRGPYLARFELCAKMVENGVNTNDLLGSTIELFIEYFRKFGHKPCCVSDLRDYLGLLDAEQRSVLSVRLIKDVGISSTRVPQTEQQMQRHICALQLSRLCGSHRNLSYDHLSALVTALSLHYQHGYQTYGMNLLSTDQGPSDPYALLAAHVLHDLAQSTKSSEPIILSIVLLNKLLKNSPSSYHAKLLCIKLYHTLGGGVGAQNMYDSLDVKHLQLDSLGFAHCARLPTTGLLNLATNLYDTTLKFFATNYKDSSDHLTYSYKFGSFLKLDEFMDFRERLNNSLHYTTIGMDRIMLSLVQCTTSEGLYNANISSKDNEISWPSLRDNNDWSVFTTWDPERISGPPEQSQDIQNLFQQDVLFLKLRAFVLWSTSTAIEIAKSTDGTRHTFVESLKGTLNDWKDLHSQVIAAKHVPLGQDQVTMPLPSRLHGFLETPYLKILGQLFLLIVGIASDDVERCNEIAENVPKHCEETLDDLSRRIERQNQSKDCYWERRTTMESVVNFTEVVSISALVCLVCSDLIKPSQGKKARKKATDLKNRETLNRVINDLKQGINRLDDMLGTWRSDEEFDLFDRLSALNLSDDGQTEVLENLKNSHIIAVKDLRGVLKSKSKFLCALLLIGSTCHF